jgi:hypothetical protein
VVNCVGQAAVHPYDDVGGGVQVDGEADVNVFRVLVCHEEYSCAGVAEIMEADLGQVRSLQEGLEVAAERVGVTRGGGQGRTVARSGAHPVQDTFGPPGMGGRSGSRSGGAASLSGLETTNDGRVVTFAGALGASGGTVDQEVAAFKIRGVLRHASGR